MVGFCFGDASGHCADADFGNQFHADRRPGVGVFQIVDQLGQIFNRVNVMMGRRGNQFDAGCRVAQHGDVLGHFLARELPAFAGFRALRHLDLDLFG